MTLDEWNNLKIGQVIYSFNNVRRKILKISTNCITLSPTKPLIGKKRINVYCKSKRFRFFIKQKKLNKTIYPEKNCKDCVNNNCYDCSYQSNFIPRHPRNIRVLDVSLTMRSLNILDRLKVKTLGDLQDIKLTKLSKLPGMGKTTFNEIKNVLKEHNLKFN